MKIFITGATGFVGKCLTELLLKDGHTVAALVRDKSKASALSHKGVITVEGTLTSLGLIREEASKANAVVHLAFIHDMTKYAEAMKTDGDLIATVIQALKGTNKPFIITSGGAVLGSVDTPADESHPVPKGPSRADSEVLAIEGAQQGVGTIVIRLPTNVYDSTGSGFYKMQAAKAQEKGFAMYTGDGKYEQSNVHVEDAAAAYVLALQHGKPGSIYHIASGKHSGKELAEATARKLGIQSRGISPEEAAEVYGSLMSIFFALNIVMDSSKARRELHWVGRYPASAYFDAIAGTL
ncbi:hypothetical protein WJX73_008369 [Symbiochloris irregularis]|uniref:NAD-dependent epimerase/dehydratase domain-containing protein n=1 Tax=Symbiochloris irregularis TaxID=706552 RepID=A0AAW1NRU1_9CHLO